MHFAPFERTLLFCLWQALKASSLEHTQELEQWKTLSEKVSDVRRGPESAEANRVGGAVELYSMKEIDKNHKQFREHMPCLLIVFWISQGNSNGCLPKVVPNGKLRLNVHQPGPASSGAPSRRPHRCRPFCLQNKNYPVWAPVVPS